MVSIKTVITICLSATLGFSQAINIRGIVKDSADIGISGAKVKLENADISTTTGSDGSFTLNGLMNIQQHINSRNIPARPIQFQNGKITIRLSENTLVAISIYNVSGKQLYIKKQTYCSGTYEIQASLPSTGIYLFKVSIGNRVYSFKSSHFGAFSAELKSVLGSASTLAKQAKATAVIADVISVVKDGQLNYRDSITTSDTSGIVVKMIPNAGNMTDTDGNVYQSVRIGNQVWAVENLKTTKYNDGTPILYVTDSGVTGGTTGWRNLTAGAYCYYDNDSLNKRKYGGLYNCYAVNTGKLAPAGWRVPTNADWDTLQNYLIANGYNWDGTTSGNKIAKSMSAQTDWNSYTQADSIINDLGKLNFSGFSALPGGYRSLNGVFYRKSDDGFWWSVTDYDPYYAYYCRIFYGFDYLVRTASAKLSGFSVRLVRA